MVDFIKRHNNIFLIVFAAVMFALALMQTILINSLVVLGIILILFSLGAVVYCIFFTSKTQAIIVGSLTALYVLFEIIFLAVDKVSIWITMWVFLIPSLITVGIYGFYLSGKNSKKLFLKILKGIVMAIFGVILIFFMSITVNPNVPMIFIQKNLGMINSFEPQTHFSVTVNEKFNLLENIKYGEEYPNSFLDILTEKDAENNRPTYFFIHGGGWTMGDKMQGDPNQVSEYSASLYHFEVMAENGYNVVTMNYALAPQYPFPTALIQIGQAVQFLTEHSAEYNLDMDKIIFSGSSAGGNLAATFVSAQANAEYAKTLGIPQTVALDRIMASVLEVPLLDFNRVSKTQKTDTMNDYIFGLSASAYIGQPLVGGDKEYKAKISPIDKATVDMPPVFIADGNYGSFCDQARDYYENLKKSGVKCELYIPDNSVGKKDHGFLADIKSECTATYIQMKLSFLRNLQNS